MADYNEIMKGLDQLESPLVRQTVEFLLKNVQNADTDEEFDVAKAAFLMYASAAAPGLLRSDVNVSGALGFNEPVAEEVVEAPVEEAPAAEEVVEEQVAETPEEAPAALLKEVLADNGIYYFGPMGVDKHFRTDSRGQYDPHTDRQEHHGNRPGKRELVANIADARAEADEEEKKDIPRRVDMLDMSPKEVLRVARRVLGNVTTSGADGANPNARVLPSTGEAGKNTTRAERRKRLG